MEGTRMIVVPVFLGTIVMEYPVSWSPVKEAVAISGSSLMISSPVI